MKKLISLFLVTLMLFAVMTPAASAANAYDPLPIIYIRGNGEQLYNADGTELSATLDGLSLGGDEGGFSKEVIVETAVNILLPFVTEGMLFDKWDNYGRALYDELSPLFAGAALDGDGNPMNGTGVSPKVLADSENASKSAWSYQNGRDYNFCYDWRLSPYDHVERLHGYIQDIMEATGKDQVSIYGRCIGGGLLMAYLKEYGDEGHIKNVIFSDVLSNEATVISKAFSGQVEFDAKLVERYAGQLDFCGRVDMGVGFVFSDILNEIVIKTMDFFNQINVTDMALDEVEALYEKLYKALIPSVCHAAGIATQANYWTCVAEEDMDAALNLLFGEKGSELRTKYAGLIAKIQKYRENVSSDLDGFYKGLEENGIHYGFVAKYGFLNAPFTKDADILSDALVSLTSATYGATTAPVGKTLSEDYIAKVPAEKQKYISADKQVDLSTAVSPETTWVFKNAHHNVYDTYVPLMKAFLNGTNETVDSLTGGVNFMLYDFDTNTYVPLTEENDCELEFMTRPEENPTTETRLISFMRFFTMIIEFITKLFKGELSFSGILG